MIHPLQNIQMEEETGLPSNEWHGFPSNCLIEHGFHMSLRLLSVSLRKQCITESLIHLTLSLSRGGTCRMGSGHSGPKAEPLISPIALSSSHLTGPRQKGKNDY